MAIADKTVCVMTTERPVDWPPIFDTPPAYRYGPTLGQYLDAAFFYKPPKRWTAANSKPSAIIQARRIKKARKGWAKETFNSHLTESYLKSTPGWLHEFYSVLAERATLKFLAAGGTIQRCPAETTMKQSRVRMGRPPIGEHAMPDDERQRRSRANRKAKTCPPQARNEPGTVVPSTPFGPAVPGPSLILEIEQMISNLLEFELAEKYHQYLGEVLDRLAAAPASYILSREEFTIVAAAGVLGRRLLKPAAEFH
jgi:hypothetical protein